MTDALQSARDRLEAFAQAMSLHPPSDPERDKEMLRRLTNDLIAAARQFDPSHPF